MTEPAVDLSEPLSEPRHTLRPTNTQAFAYRCNCGFTARSDDQAIDHAYERAGRIEMAVQR